MRRSNLITREETLKNNFNEIVHFYKVHKKEPNSEANNLYERLLAKRLVSIKELYRKYEFLSELDIYGILAKRNISKPLVDKKEENKFSSLANLVKHSNKKKTHPPQTAKKTICTNFSLYRPLFIDVRIGLGKKEYKEEIIKGNDKEIKIGDYFISNEVLNYVSDLTEEITERGTNIRLKVITEEGLEFDILYQSFVRGLYRNIKLSSRIVTLGNPLPALNSVAVSGYIYILGSLNQYSELNSYEDNLFKINFATEATERKINDAHLYTSYLESPVHVVSVIQCFNVDMVKLKKELGIYLKQYELKDVSIRNRIGNIYKIKNWYHISLSELENIILNLGNLM